MAKKPLQDRWINWQLGPGFFLQLVALVFYFGIMYSELKSTKEMAEATSIAFQAAKEDIAVLKSSYALMTATLSRIEGKIDKGS